MSKITTKKHQRKPKLCLITSSGGHFYQIYQLKEWWSNFDHFWVALDREDTKNQLKNEKVYFGYFPENRNIVNAVKHSFLALYTLIKEKPDILFSTGAGIAPPFFFIGKLLNKKLIFLETASYINRATLSGKLIYPIADHFIVQHKSSLKLYPHAEMKGGLI